MKSKKKKKCADGQLYSATATLDRPIHCGMGTICSSPISINTNSSLLIRVGLPPPSVGLRERLEMCRVNFHRWRGLNEDHISHNNKKSNSFDKTTANIINSAPFLQRLRLGNKHYHCQTLSGEQFMAVAVDSAFHSNLAACGLQPQRSIV